MAPEKKIKKARKKKAVPSNEEMRKIVSSKFTRVSERLDTLARRYFAGVHDKITKARVQVDALAAEVLAYDDDWKPKSRGKNALVPGNKVMLKPGLTKEDLVEYDWVEANGRSLEDFFGATIDRESESKHWIVKMTDGHRARVSRKHFTAFVAPE